MMLTEFERMNLIGDEFPLPLVDPKMLAKINTVVLAMERAVLSERAGMHAAAVALLGGLGYAWIGSEWTQNTPKEYGCHCDLEPGMKPDSCVLDYGNANDCIHAPGLVAAGKGREDCHEWRQVVLVLHNVRIEPIGPA